MPETLALSPLARTAIALHQAQVQASANALAGEILAAMGLAPADGWHVDFATQTAVRRAAPDEAPTP